ncbi:glycosyltransferase family 4 protein [Chitinimonas arctica]|uniref:Glycosyltransferase family 4 protein n=1 Tax=Chitinimonas arctica TaxID=2594795 RepID=A0A516SGH1_9NEIS|nr:glycosyltransferase family 4 protein [Chitinimonas arctica]QDQ27267.1 glycosyltransferase family 4 protein [Chitinimonas arctica]
MSNFLFCESSPNLGGQELQILLQMQALTQAGHRVLLACKASSRIAAEAERNRLPWQAVGFRNSLHFPSIAALRSLMHRHAIDIALCHSGHDANNLAMAARLASRRPRLIRARTYQPGLPKAISYNRLVDRTLVPSEYLRTRILANPAIRPERVAVLRPLLDLAAIHRQAEQALPSELAEVLADAGPVIVQAAMLRPEKGHRVVLAALPALCRQYPRLKLVLAGAGPEERVLREQVAALGLDGHVHFAGLLVPVYPLLARADLVIMPSLEEPLGLSQLEALALGVPVAVSNTGGLPETVTANETGWLIAAGEVDAWRDGLADALADPARGKAYAARGRRFVEEHYSASAHIEALMAQIALA